jgi:dihydropteroate synthase
VIWKLPGREISFPRRPLVMGIVNVNDDSFSGDGTLDVKASLARARLQAEAGADVVDVGAESARTNRRAVPVGEELRRFGEFFRRWPEALDGAGPVDGEQVWPPVLSANTWRPEVVRALLAEPFGIELLNDMGGLPDDRNARLCAEHGVSLLLMHSAGEPKVARLDQRWDDVLAAIERFFEEKLAMAEAAGVERGRIVLDPGIDFAKPHPDNLAVLREFQRFLRFDRPVLAPISRKTVVGETLGLAEPADRDAGTIACLAAVLRRGAHIVRVHNVEAAWQSVAALAGIGACERII